MPEMPPPEKVAGESSMETPVKKRTGMPPVMSVSPSTEETLRERSRLTSGKKREEEDYLKASDTLDTAQAQISRPLSDDYERRYRDESFRKLRFAAAVFT